MADNRKKTIVVVEEKAFMGMLLAAVEAFPTRFRPGKSRRPNGTSPEGEVFGLLFGQRLSRNDGHEVFNVTLAVPNQIIYERRVDGITASGTHVERIRELTEVFPAYQFLGAFHSHPCKRKDFHWLTAAEHSDGERSSVVLAEEIGQKVIEIIFALTCCKTKASMTINFPHVEPHLIHNCCGLYKHSFACYCAEYDSVTGKRAFLPADNLICPMASDINSVLLPEWRN